MVEPAQGPTKFYVLLGSNPAAGLAVIEATSEQHLGVEILHPVKPESYARTHSAGIRRDDHGGWVETDGPARILTPDEHRSLIASMDPDQTVAETNETNIATAIPAEAGEDSRIDSVKDLPPELLKEIFLACHCSGYRMPIGLAFRLLDLGFIVSYTREGKAELSDDMRKRISSWEVITG